MFELTGQASTCCNGVTRRDFVRIGTLGLGGLTLSSLLKHRAESASSGESPPKTAVIFVELDGGPSQIETYDPKPEAPLEYRGAFSPVQTNVPGVAFSETMIEQSRVMDKMAVIRSLSHTSADHGNSGHLICTGYYRGTGQGGPQEKPGVGAVASRVRGPNTPAMPSYVALLGQMRYAKGLYLGHAHDPFTVDDSPNKKDFRVKNLALGPNLDFDRLNDRRNLLAELDTQRRLADIAATAKAIDTYTYKAFEMITNGRAAEAFNIHAEPERIRDRYGRNHLGQAMLLARRLVEAGVMFVSVREREWDDHSSIELRSRKLRPRYDKAMAALIADLYQRGLDKHVLLVALGEFGRTPKINKGAGRDHWPQVMSAVLSGGGLRVGQVVGSSTSRAEEPREKPYRPDNVLAMVYRHLGIDPSTTFPDYNGRPQYLLEHRGIIGELI